MRNHTHCCKVFREVRTETFTAKVKLFMRTSARLSDECVVVCVWALSLFVTPRWASLVGQRTTARYSAEPALFFAF